MGVCSGVVLNKQQNCYSKNEINAYCLCKIGLIIRKMHYPPETASVMLIAQMIATVLQVSIFMEIISFRYMYFKCCLHVDTGASLCGNY